MQHIIHWENKVTAPWKRALDLKKLQMINGGLHLQVEEESGKLWSFDFKPVQAWKVTSEEYAGNIITSLPEDGSLFLAPESEWLKELNAVNADQKLKHFIVCCYDEIVEVIAWHCSIVSLAS